MEFLDSLDFQTKKKTNRVRSWDLYEQFKSLENNQLEAAKKLKNRSYQEKILRKELSERKARRSLYDQCERSRTGSQIASSVKSSHTRASLNASDEDFLESCYQFEGELNDLDEQSEIELCQDDSRIVNDEHQSSEFKSIADVDDSITSVVENLKDSENITDEIKEELEFVKHGIAENITLQLEAAKENVQYLEQFSDFCEVDKLSKKENVQSTVEGEEIKAIALSKDSREASLDDNSLIAAWMKLVNFAYQVIKLNHGGNCYCDYSSQFLIAVLACDVLRRGINRMCDMLQPYVCPIKFSNDETNSSANRYKNVKKEKQNERQKPYFEPCPLRSKNGCKSRCYKRKFNSENYSNRCVERRNFKNRIASDPLPSFARLSARGCNNKTRSTLWPSELQSETSTRQCHCPCCTKHKKNPMLKVTKYIDDLLVQMDRL